MVVSATLAHGVPLVVFSKPMKETARRERRILCSDLVQP